MDTKLSEFTTRTCCDPGLALDLLKSHQWIVKDAINAYYVIKGIVQEDEPNGLLARDEIDSGLDVQFRLPAVSCGSLPSLPSPSSPPPDPIGSTTSSTNSSPSKLAISKTDIRQDLLSGIYPVKKLSRGISRATDNVNLVSRARSEFAQEFGASLKSYEIEEKESSIDICCTLYQKAPETFTLPDLSIHSPDFSEFLKKDLIEKSSLISLESAGRLNWWADTGICQRLWPLATSGDGNCLLHAASLGMWGFHDRLLTLRKALHAVLSNSSFTDSFYRRWRWQSSIQNKAAGLILCEEEWLKEWATLLKMASTEPRVRASNGSSESKKNGLTGGKKAETLPEEELQPHVYESLEELHIMALAHVLHRPIIVVADTMLKDVTGEPFAPIPFGGIYLPLECDASKCHRSPLCLTYDAAHFSALVAMDKETYADDTPKLPAAIPLVDSQCNLLSLQFSIDPGSTVTWNKDENNDQVIQSKSLTHEQQINLLSKYLDILYVNKPSQNDKSPSIVSPEAKINNSVSSTAAATTTANSVNRCNTPCKSATLPAKIEVDSKSSTLVGSISAQSEHLHGSGRKKLKFFISLRKRFGKRFRKNITTFARQASMRFRKNTKNLSKPSENKCSEDDSAKGTSDVSISSATHQNDRFICAVLHTEKKPDYREEMIRNYLSSARFRFKQSIKEDDVKSHSDSSTKSTCSTLSNTPLKEDDSKSLTPSLDKNNEDARQSNSPSPTKDVDYTSPCANKGCNHFGTATTSYLCSKCFLMQKVTAINIQNDFTDV